MLRRLVLAVLLLGVACTEKKAEPAPAAQAPDTKGVEGHGGIAIAEPSKTAAPAGAKPAPSELPSAEPAGRVDPEDFKLQQAAAELQRRTSDRRTEAKDLYLRAYQLKDTDPAEARKLFGEVLDRTPPSDEYHQKAASQIRSLQRR